MTYKKFQLANNAKWQLEVGISAVATEVILKTWQWDLFNANNGTTDKTYLWTLVKFDTDGVIILKNEIVEVTKKSWDTFTIVRSYGTCPWSDASKTQWTTAYAFDEGDYFFMNNVAEIIKDIQDELETFEATTTQNFDEKLDITEYQQWQYIYGSTSAWSDAYAITLPNPPVAYTTGQIFRFQADVGNTWSATLNVNAIGAITIKKLHDQDLETGDIEAWQIVVVAYDWTNFQMNSQVAIITEAETWKLQEQKLYVWEDWNGWDCLFLEQWPTFIESTGIQNVGDVAWNTRVAIKAFWNWIAWNSFRISLKKFVSPWANFNIRIETDNSWNASWTLIDPNATGTVDPATILTALWDIDVQIAWTITIPEGQLCWVVCYVWTYWSETVNWTNYYWIWYVARDTNINSSKTYDWSVYSANATKAIYLSKWLFATSTKTENMDWTWFPTDWTSISWTYSVAWWRLVAPSAFTATYPVGWYNMSIEWKMNLVVTSWRQDTYRGVKLYIDANNYISFSMFYNMSWWGWPYREFKVKILKAWVAVVNNVNIWTYATLAEQNLKITYVDWLISCYIFTTARILLATYQYDFPQIKYWIFFVEASGWSSPVMSHSFDDIIVSELWDWNIIFKKNILMKTDADFSYKLPTDYLRIAKEAFVAWTIPKVTIPWSIINSIPNVTANSEIFLSWTPWWTAKTPWTYKYLVWKVLPDWINVWQNSKNLLQIAQTTGASPYTYQNTTWNPLIMTITGWTVSAIAISRDWTNFFQVWSATNTQVILQTGDSVKITRSWSPTLTVFYQ